MILTRWDGEAVAALTGIEPDRVFKTLVTVGASRRYYVFDVPVNCTLSLKKAAHAVGEKEHRHAAAKGSAP